MSLILVVDDEPMIRCALRRLLESAGHTVLESTNGEEALAVAQEKAPEVILTDLQMPGFGGIGLLRAIERAGLKVRIIALSGESHDADLQIAYELGAQVVVTKPFIEDELLGAIDKVRGAEPQTG